MACSGTDNQAADKLNEASYTAHYRSIQQAENYARKAYSISSKYPSGRAEALNNLAFANIAKMNYKLAEQQLDSVTKTTDNQIELLIAEIQRMRLCQRQSRNKDFYEFKTHAMQLIRRIEEEKEKLTPHMAKRWVYAKSEYSVVASTYFYYVGLHNQSQEAIKRIDKNEIIQQDTAQYLNWLYQIGSGGILSDTNRTAILQKEYDALLECYFIAREHKYTYWEANALQSIAEHLFDNEDRAYLEANNASTLKIINPDNMPDSLLAGYLAQKSIGMFSAYGDIYQTAGSIRTLAKCFWVIKDYKSALYWLDRALHLDNSKIKQTPDLVASIREQLSIVYSSLNDKHNSDINRNIYLDLQETTRQDMELDARASQLERTSGALNTMILAIVVLITLLSFLIFRLLKNGSGIKTNATDIDNTITTFQKQNTLFKKELELINEELKEKLDLEIYNNAKNKSRNIQNRAKVFLVESVKPLINRIVNEINCLLTRGENKAKKAERYEYIKELNQKIEEYNDFLTEWIKLKQGEIGIQIESFPLACILNTVRHSKPIFSLQDINLEVEHSDLIVKADRILTLFMINTIADNARKFTPRGGDVKISTADKGDYVEISISDNGKGIASDELKNLFTRSINNGHGFGLINCKGILDRYKKYSKLFAPCTLAAESALGKGSRFFFTLPKGTSRSIIALLIASAAMCHIPSSANSGSTKNFTKAETQTFQHKATAYADSTYFCNIDGRYSSALAYADSTIKYLNAYYLAEHPKGKCLMNFSGNDDTNPAEIQWFRSGFSADYSVILSIRNESAVAALALHKWNVYNYNNSVYTKLFKIVSADNTLGEYCQIMQKSEMNKNIAITILIILLCILLAVCYIIFYRRALRRHGISDLLSMIKSTLLSDDDIETKIKTMKEIEQSPYCEEIKDVFKKVLEVLNDAREQLERILTDKTCTDEKLQQLTYENGRLYVSNNILENCLSTIKHETMYYPSRIKMFVEENKTKKIYNDSLNTLKEIVEYYRELYFALCLQLHCQVENAPFTYRTIDISQETNIVIPPVYGDDFFIHMLLDILRKENNGKPPHYSVKSANKDNITICADMSNVTFTNKSANVLFIPKKKNLPFMICRQIIREIENSSNHYGCGITAESHDGKLRLNVTLPVAGSIYRQQETITEHKRKKYESI